MNGTLQITFRGMPPSPAVERRIRERADKLERFHGRIGGCRVVVEAPHRHHAKGRLYAVRLIISIPGQEVLVSKGVGEDHAYEDVYVAVRDAFDAAARRLDDVARRRTEALAPAN
jgi:ribosome-associated translation inhibitor RaiA